MNIETLFNKKSYLRTYLGISSLLCLFFFPLGIYSDSSIAEKFTLILYAIVSVIGYIGLKKFNNFKFSRNVLILFFGLAITINTLSSDGYLNTIYSFFQTSLLTIYFLLNLKKTIIYFAFIFIFLFLNYLFPLSQDMIDYYFLEGYNGYFFLLFALINILSTLLATAKEIKNTKDKINQVTGQLEVQEIANNVKAINLKEFENTQKFFDSLRKNYPQEESISQLQKKFNQLESAIYEKL